MSTHVHPNTARALLARYEIATPPTDARFLNHALVDVGVPVEITASVDPDRGRVLRVGLRGEYVEAICPCSHDTASRMVEQLQRKRLIPQTGQAAKTLAHLLQRCSALVAETQLEHFSLSPVYVNHDGYRTHTVDMIAEKPLTITKRLASDAHDRGAVFPARRTGRRTGARK